MAEKKESKQTCKLCGAEFEGEDAKDELTAHTEAFHPEPPPGFNPPPTVAQPVTIVEDQTKKK